MKLLLTLAMMASMLGTAQAAVPNTQSETNEDAGSIVKVESVQTETSKIPEVGPKKNILGNFTLGLDSEANKAITSDNKSYDGDVETYQYLKLGYKFTDKTSLTAVSTWTQRLGYKENSSQTTFEDFHLRLTKSDLFSLGKMKVTGQGRAYLPTSDLSQDISQVAQLRGYLIGNTEITKKLSSTVLVSPRYYIYEQDKRITGRNDYRVLYSTGLKYSFTDAFAAESTLGIYSKKKIGSEMSYFQDYSTSVYYTFNKNIMLNGGVRATDGAVDTDKGGFELYNQHASEYYAIAFISI